MLLDIRKSKHHAAVDCDCRGPGSSVGIATGYELDSPGIFYTRPKVKPPGCGADHLPPSSAEVTKG
jgi:hypothetical protein